MKKNTFHILYTIIILSIFFLGMYFFRDSNNNIDIKIFLITTDIIVISFPIIQLITNKKKKGATLTFLGCIFFFVIFLIPITPLILLAIFDKINLLRTITFILVVLSPHIEYYLPL